MPATGHPEEDLIPISALQHLAYCRRQFALIHVEQIWEENRYTAEGQLLHRAVDAGKGETRNDLHVARALPLRCRALGLSGKGDVVEFHRVEKGCRLPARDGFWQPYPVEYKRGRAKLADWDRIQLCAQALALEEMYGVPVRQGALFYGKTRRREVVQLDQPLRGFTAELAKEAREILESQRLPPPQPGPKCDRCSLVDTCMPHRADPVEYLKRMLDT